MHQGWIRLLELGSNSLKVYIEGAPGNEEPEGYPKKLHWDVARSFYSQGQLSEASVTEVVDKIRSVEELSKGIPASSRLAVATGVFRELDPASRDKLLSRLEDQVTLRPKIMTGEDEAKLLAKAFREKDKAGSALLWDVGGGSTQWAWVEDGHLRGCGSLKLGAIRNCCQLREWEVEPQAYLRQSHQLCDSELAVLEVPRGLRVLVSGGTAKAAMKCARKASLSMDDLDRWIQHVQSQGAPENLRPERRQVLLPGLILLHRILHRCASGAIEYASASVGEGLGYRLLQALQSHGSSDLHATLLLYTRPM